MSVSMDGPTRPSKSTSWFDATLNHCRKVNSAKGCPLSVVTEFESTCKRVAFKICFQYEIYLMIQTYAIFYITSRLSCLQPKQMSHWCQGRKIRDVVVG